MTCMEVGLTIWGWIEMVGYISGFVFSYQKWSDTQKYFGIFSREIVFNQKTNTVDVINVEKLSMYAMIGCGIGTITSLFLIIGISKVSLLKT